MTPDTSLPQLMGEQRPFFDFWSEHILRDDDPHRQRWIDYEETAVERAEARNDLLRRFTSLEGSTVLDVGCQNGAWLIALGRAGARPVGLEVDAMAVEAARIRTSACRVEARVEVGSACEMPFATGEFDVVASSDVLEHVPDKVAMIHECVRVLRPGGLLFLAAPQRLSLKHAVSDPHYGRPGISPLPGRAAGFVAVRWMGEVEYEVETLPTRLWTERQLVRRGMEILSTDGTPGTRPEDSAWWRRLTDELRQGFTIVARRPD
jgi:SAM-dependent methyltransferase